MVSLDPKVSNEYSLFKIGGANPFAPGKVAFTGGEEAVSGAGFSERHGNGKAAGVASNGVLGYVEGTGENGKHRLDLYA